MDVPDLTPLLEQLEVNLDNLEDALEPLLQHALSERAAALPLLDRAKLYVLVTYAIESILFSLLRLSGVNAKEHPVFRELTRVKQYFEKIKAVETSGVEKKNLSLNKEAAGRMIKHALAAYNPDRMETLPKGEAKVQARADILARRIAAEEAIAAAAPDVQKKEDDSSSESDGEDQDPVSEKVKEEPVENSPLIKKRRRSEVSEQPNDEGSPVTKKRQKKSGTTAAERKKERRNAKANKRDNIGKRGSRGGKRVKKEKMKKIRG